MGMGDVFRWGVAEGEDSSTAAVAAVAVAAVAAAVATAAVAAVAAATAAVAPAPVNPSAVASREAGDSMVGEDEESRGRTHSSANNSLGLLASAAMSGSSTKSTTGAIGPSP